MTPVGEVQITGRPSAQEAAAIVAAVQVLIDGETPAGAPQLPAAYRSGWRRAAIMESIRVSHDRRDVDVS